MQRVSNGCALCQKFGIGNDIDCYRIFNPFPKACLDLVVGSDRYSRFHNDDTVPFRRFCDLIDDGVEVGKVGGTVFLFGGADSDDNNFRIAVGSRRVRRKCQAGTVFLQ